MKYARKNKMNLQDKLFMKLNSTEIELIEKKFETGRYDEEIRTQLFRAINNHLDKINIDKLKIHNFGPKEKYLVRYWQPEVRTARLIELYKILLELKNGN